MNKKEYIEKLENLILQRVKYHAPNLESSDIDFELLNALGIDSKYPIFVFKKPLNKIFFKAFENAKKQAKFNLILLEKPLCSLKKIEKLENTYLILKDEIGSNLYRVLEALNINYLTRSNFNKEFEDEYIKVNGQNLLLDYQPYFLTNKIVKSGIIFHAKEFLLNGKNFIINMTNTKTIDENALVEINIPLPRGYYIFKKNIDHIEIENLTNRQKAYFNYHFKNANFKFSAMSGIESSTFACINMTFEINLLPKQTKKIYFNFGENKYCIYSPKMMEYFFDLSQKKFDEIFDIKIQTRDINFDNNFNLYLPQKIWEKWQKFDVDEESINKWLKMKSEIVKISEKGEQISPLVKGLKEVKFFRNSSWKRVFVLHNDSCYMFANKVKYFNYTLLTNEIFEKNNEIYLSFAT